MKNDLFKVWKEAYQEHWASCTDPNCATCMRKNGQVPKMFANDHARDNFMNSKLPSDEEWKEVWNIHKSNCKYCQKHED
jgi:hypothetical protein